MTKDEIIENLNLIVAAQQEEVKDLQHSVAVQRSRNEILMHLIDLGNDTVEMVKSLAANYATAHADDVERFSGLLDKAEQKTVELSTKLKALTDERNELLDKLLDRNVTVTQLEDQLTDQRIIIEELQEKVHDLELDLDAEHRYDPGTII